MTEMQHLYPCSKLKLDQLFLQWLSLPESQALVSTLIEDAKAGRPVKGPAGQSANAVNTSTTPLSPSTTHTIFSSTPPLSPQKSRSPRSPLSPARRSSTGSILKRAPLGAIPQFYYPPGTQVSDDTKQTFLFKTSRYFSEKPQGLPEDKFVQMASETCALPKYLGHALFQRLASTPAGADAPLVTHASFTDWWLAHNLLNVQPERVLFDVLRQPGCEYLTHEDVRPLLNAVLACHPGLEFLQDTPEFQTRYAETVIYRIFYTNNRNNTGKMTFREVRRSDLLDTVLLLEREEDINRVLKYFSYEHFYVIYCKFWELDQDHDFHISRDDLLKYGSCCLTDQIVNRVFEQAPRVFKSKEAGMMGYEDFVWFILSEEDKASDTALEYWFRCIDLDSDGVLRPFEMWFFYEEQMKRLESMSQEAVLFEDVLCQLHDMLQPETEGAYTLKDLRRMRPMASVFFNILFNLPKFMAFENRDPFALRAEQAGEDGSLTEWDRFARIEYMRLAVEDDTEEMQVDNTDDMWVPQTDPAGGEQAPR